MVLGWRSLSLRVYRLVVTPFANQHAMIERLLLRIGAQWSNLKKQNQKVKQEM